MADFIPGILLTAVLLPLISFFVILVAGNRLRENASTVATGAILLSAVLSFISFFGPIIGIALGFDAINSERTQGTLSRVLAQPVYRDAVFNGKFLAAMLTLAVILAVVALLL